MTSEQVMLTLAALWITVLSGCTVRTPKGADALESPYTERRVWALAPLRNESGSQAVRGDQIADHLARQLENASNLDVLPVNRTLAAMEGLGLAAVTTPAEAMKVLGALGADGLVIGTVTAYDPYDPPKLGLAIELYTGARAVGGDAPELRNLRSAAVERDTSQAGAGAAKRPRQPISVVSAFFDAADPDVRRKIQRYAYDRGATSRHDDRWLDNPFAKDDGSWRTYRISMDLYTEFVSYVMSWRLLRAEARRLAPPETEVPQATLGVTADVSARPEHPAP